MLDAYAYLSTLKQRLPEGEWAGLNLQVTSSVAIGMDVAATLMRIAESVAALEEVEGFKGCDMIAMATHGGGGLERWVMGSVTQRVLGATKLPLLIVRLAISKANKLITAEV